MSDSRMLGLQCEDSFRDKAVPAKKPAAKRRTFNIGDDLYLKLRKVAYRERLNATLQLERALDQFFKDYEKTNRIKIDDIEIPDATSEG